jgi:hypothetical protein
MPPAEAGVELAADDVAGTETIGEDEPVLVTEALAGGLDTEVDSAFVGGAAVVGPVEAATEGQRWP